ncbi:hypothetical protein E2C01_037236 [Portunus trituberculatus]|uniref:Uncharacterized protein n=1 Tax=Portunus trituberculatus TaxID=210409 RepID=A0A5B7FE44_PORTR|nr:hypothetical protein [Portunus trituberculatus]
MTKAAQREDCYELAHQLEPRDLTMPSRITAAHEGVKKVTELDTLQAAFGGLCYPPSPCHASPPIFGIRINFVQAPLTSRNGK